MTRLRLRDSGTDPDFVPSHAALRFCFRSRYVGSAEPIDSPLNQWGGSSDFFRSGEPAGPMPVPLPLHFLEQPDDPSWVLHKWPVGIRQVNHTTGTEPLALTKLRQLLATPLTEAMDVALRKDETFALALAALVEEIHKCLPDRPLELAYEPGDDVADWILYVYLRGDSLREDLAKLDRVYEEYLPKQGPAFNKKIVLVPL